MGSRPLIKIEYPGLTDNAYAWLLDIFGPRKLYTVTAFTNSWVNYGQTWKSAAYWKDPFGIVHLEGLIKSGSVGSAAFTLPLGYRPSADCLFGIISNSAIGRVDVNSSGGVVPLSPSNNTWVQLDGINFYAG